MKKVVGAPGEGVEWFFYDKKDLSAKKEKKEKDARLFEEKKNAGRSDSFEEKKAEGKGANCRLVLRN